MIIATIILKVILIGFMIYTIIDTIDTIYNKLYEWISQKKDTYNPVHVKQDIHTEINEYYNPKIIEIAMVFTKDQLYSEIPLEIGSICFFGESDHVKFMNDDIDKIINWCNKNNYKEIFFMHNHPSNDPDDDSTTAFSLADIFFTNQLATWLREFSDCKLVDHFVYGKRDNKLISMKDLNKSIFFKKNISEEYMKEIYIKQ